MLLTSLLALNLVVGLSTATTWAASAVSTDLFTGASTSNVQFMAEHPVLSSGNYSSALNVAEDVPGQLSLGREQLRPPRWSGDWNNFGMFSGQASRFAQPFNTIKASWEADVPAGTHLEIDLRVSPDNQNWTLWQTLQESGQTASFGADYAFLYVQYRVRLFSAKAGLTPVFKGVKLEANSRDLLRVETASYFTTASYNSAEAANPVAAPAPAPPPTFKVYATREGMVGATTANGHVIQPRDHFVSLPSWTALNDPGKHDYQVRITAPNGRSAVAPVWDVGPWNFKDNYWHNPRNEFKDLPVGVPQAEKAFFDKHNNGLNENGDAVYNPSGIDIGDGTYWDDLGLDGASAGKLDVTFLWEGGPQPAANLTDVTASGAWHNGVIIKWNSSTATSSRVEYGLSGNYGQSSPVDNNMISNHTVVLTDLVPGQTYHFRVHGVDIYGNESVSTDATFSTLPGVNLPLATFQGDKGIGITAGKNSEKLLLLGARVNPTLWNDNPNLDYLAGAKTAAGAVANTGNLDFDLVPVCDEKGQNCTMGYGTGYKNFVRFANSKGENFEIGLIHDSGGLSPGSVTLMVEGNLKDKTIRQYNAPDSTDQKVAHHFHFFWWENKILVMFDFGAPQVFDFNGDGLTISFEGAGRAKNDIVAANFNNIAFSPNALANPQH